MLASTRGSIANTTHTVALTTLERRLVVRSDAPQILYYIASAYRRACATAAPDPQAAPCDRGAILANRATRWLVFNGEPVEYAQDKPTTHFRLAFYGCSKLIRLSFRRNHNWHSLYAAALRIGQKAVVISAPSGIGKTTLALELMSRGARFYSDEFVFIRKSDRVVSGLPRALLVRERTLSLFPDARLKAVCEGSMRRSPHGDAVWDNIDPGDVFGEEVFASPAELGAAVVFERGHHATAIVEPISPALAAADFNKRVNADTDGFARLVDSAAMLRGIPCFRVAASTPQTAAIAIEGLLR